MRKKLLTLIFLLSFSSVTYPLSDQLALLFGSIPPVLTYYFTKNKSYWVSLPATIGVGGLSYLFFEQWTPGGKFRWALKNYERITSNYLVLLCFEDSSELFEKIKDGYVVSSYYLAEAHDDLAVNFGCSLRQIDLLRTIKSDYSFDDSILPKSEILLQKFLFLNEKIKQLLKIIREHPDFQQQMNSYKQEKAAEKALAVQQQMAWAQSHMAWNLNRR